MADKIELASVDELDAWIRSVDSAKSVEEKVARMSGAVFLFDFGTLRKMDPFSPAYRAMVESMYESISDSEYQVEHEKENFSESWISNPFPYLTKSRQSVGENLIGIGTIIKNFPLPPPASVLEMGSGWGNVALALGRTGYIVDALDIDDKCGRLIQHWADKYGISDRVHSICTDFDSAADTVRRQYDVILFFKSFHHSLNHMTLLESCGRMLKQGGFIVFAAEPIIKNYVAPWCLRNDGLSIYMIRKNRWLELGFDESYFDSALDRAGFVLHKRITGQQVATANLSIYQKQ